MDPASKRSSLLAHHSTRSSNPNVFSDEYALQPVETDNGRQRSWIGGLGGPSALGEISDAETLTRQHSPNQHVRPILRDDTASTMARQSSISSRLTHSQSVASSSDTHTSSTPRRSTTTSSFGISRAQSPYQGATGPSHPYAMYSQDTNISRTPSVATTSTTRRPERPYSGPRGPTQPYGMYPQNTVLIDEQDPFNDSAHVVEGIYPPGSRPAPRSYQRRLGPDGEDVDDLIGPDGYTEQLPAYTRYANDIPPKRDFDANSHLDVPVSNQQRRLAQSDDAAHHMSNSENSPIATSPIIVHPPTENPFNDSLTQINSSQVSSTIAVDGVPKDEVESCARRTHDKSKRRVYCGIMPCWLLAVFLMAVLLAVLIGGIVGGVLAHSQGVRKGLSEPQAAMSPLP